MFSPIHRLIDWLVHHNDNAESEAPELTMNSTIPPWKHELTPEAEKVKTRRERSALTSNVNSSIDNDLKTLRAEIRVITENR